MQSWLSKYILVPFGLTKALATLINVVKIFYKHRAFTIVLFEHITVYLKKLDDNKEHLMENFEVFHACNTYVNDKKKITILKKNY